MVVGRLLAHVSPVVYPSLFMPGCIDGVLLTNGDTQHGRRTARGTRRVTQETPKLQKPTRLRTQFGPPPTKPLPMEPIVETESAPVTEAVVKQVKPKKPKQKNDPKLVTAARELRDRWLEQMNAEERSPIEQGGHIAQGKYDVSRRTESANAATAQNNLFRHQLVA
jgi:hypothetical protein